ncbi:hypothetical protein [Sulfurovum sp.]|uniref:hypothetical protein n=1 Tax=Sulfurovum sp. TaxID=1969726 RepID=UPI0035692598
MTKATGAVIGRPKTEKGKKQDRLHKMLGVARSTVYGLFNKSYKGLGYDKAKELAGLIGGHPEVWMRGGDLDLRNEYLEESKI